MKDVPRPINFPKEWLPAVWGAIRRQEIKWGKDSLIGGAGSTQFEWASAQWRYEELFERPMSIRQRSAAWQNQNGENSFT